MKELPRVESEYSITVTTAGDKDSARAIGRLLVEKRLAACVQMIPIESIYVWQGKVCEEGETAMLIKSKTSLFGEIKALIRENHGYEVPEIIQIPITGGLPEYLQWIAGCVDAKNG
ncbi:MAG: divalent-cation tolerance protein CutA [Treponema sp.]|nr:divalent-cation tolerance protein CutA [Treponema sp.]